MFDRMIFNKYVQRSHHNSISNRIICNILTALGHFNIVARANTFKLFSYDCRIVNWPILKDPNHKELVTV